MLLNYLILISQIITIILLSITISFINSLYETKECLSLDLLKKYYLSPEDKKKLEEEELKKLKKLS